MCCKLVVGNWKMNGLGVSLSELGGIVVVVIIQIDVLICLFVILVICVVVEVGFVVIGGQDCYVNILGVYMGDVLVEMFKDLGVSYVIFGYFECCVDYGESDVDVVVKIEVVWGVDLVVVVCFGESFEECEGGLILDVIKI